MHELVEVERKRRVTDAAGLHRRLRVCGFRTGEPTVEIDVYYSRADVDFLATRECLRVRWRGEHAEITHKPASTSATSSTSGVIAKTEITVTLASAQDATQAQALLAALGMVRLCEVRKHRQSFTHPEHDGLTVAVDDITGVGVFVEVEVLTRDPVSGVALLDQIEDVLALRGEEVITEPYRDLVIAAASPG